MDLTILAQFLTLVYFAPGEKPAQRGVGRPKVLSASLQSDERAERPPPSRPAPLRPPPLTIPSSPSLVSASSSPTPAVLQKPTTPSSRESESEVKLSRKSEVEANKLSRKPVSEAKNDDASKVSLNKKEGAPQKSKISSALRRLRNR